MDEDKSTTQVSVKQLAAMLAGVADNYSVGCTVKALHFNRSAANRHVVLEVDTGHGCTHDEWIDVPEKTCLK